MLSEQILTPGRGSGPPVRARIGYATAWSMPVHSPRREYSDERNVETPEVGRYRYRNARSSK